MSALLVGYARVSTHDQDLTAQRNALATLGVSDDRTYVDHGLTGTNRERPGLREALAACRSGDTLVVTKLDRLARSLPDAREILEDLTRREVKHAARGSGRSPAHCPSTPARRDRLAGGCLHKSGRLGESARAFQRMAGGDRQGRSQVASRVATAS